MIALIGEKLMVNQLLCFDFSNSVSAALNAGFKRRPLKKYHAGKHAS